MKTKVTTIDLTPSWHTQVQMCIMILNDNSTPDESREAATDELLRMADFMDKLRGENK